MELGPRLGSEHEEKEEANQQNYEGRRHDPLVPIPSMEYQPDLLARLLLGQDDPFPH